MIVAQERQEQETLRAASNFFAALEEHGVRYCHWKSNRRLLAALNGKTDLDLLIDRSQRDQFCELLTSHDLKQMLAAPGKDYPGIEHHLGFDQETGKLFHLHVHYALVLGEQHVKNYRIPLEELFLERVQMLHGVRVPVPELELIVLALRALLKYRDRDGLKDVLRIRKPGLPVHIREEIAWLLEQTSPPRVEALLAELGDRLPGAEIGTFLQSIAGDPRGGGRFLLLRGRVRRALSGYQRRSRLTSVLTYFGRSGQRTLAYAKLTPKQKMSLPRRGVTLAVVGADGAGKSTVVEEIIRWLSWRLSVRLYYMGSARPSPPTRLVQALTRTTRLVEAGCRRLLGAERWPGRLVATGYRHLLAMRYVAEGADRYHRWRAGRRAARRGSVVVYDRYPLPGVSVGERIMDGPRVPSLFPSGASGLGHFLARAEAGFYARIGPPDRLFVLHVSPEVSQARKPDHSPAAIHAKSQALAALAGAATTNGEMIHIQADQPLEQVLCAVRQAIWPLL